MIDYKALAERIDAMARSYEDRSRLARTTQEDGTSERHSECAADLRTVVSLLEGMAEAEPFAWAVRDTNPLFPEPGPWNIFYQTDEPYIAWTHHEKVPLYTRPAPLPTAIPAPFMHLLGHAYGLSLGTDWNRGTHAEHYRRPLLDAVAECKRWLGSAPQPQPCTDPACPCQDGDPCHYVDHGKTKAMPKPQPAQSPELTDELLEVGRKAIEDALIECRDERISEPMRGNGMVIREKDGTPSDVIRFGPETALRIGYRAMLNAAPTPPAQADDGHHVYVRLTRPEGYEDVHPDLVLEDAHIHPAFAPEVVSEPTCKQALQVEPTEAQIEAATDAWQAHCGLLLLSREDARDEVLIVLRAALAARE